MKKCKYLLHGLCHNNAKFIELNTKIPKFPNIENGYLSCNENFDKPECECYEPTEGANLRSTGFKKRMD